jgi:hypothetical protein
MQSSVRRLWAVGGSIPAVALAATFSTIAFASSVSTVSFLTTKVASPTAPAALSSVACISESDCIGVGHVGGSHVHPLIERWQGGAWQIMSTPVVNQASLAGISCPGADACLAVGSTSGTAGTASRTLVEAWNGGTWHRLASPSPPQSALGSVDCVSFRNCWASGFKNGGGPQEAAMFEHWNGRLWSSRTAPKGHDVLLGSLSCMSSTDCWAMGTEAAHRLHQPWVADHWNGQSWTAATLPPSGRYQGELAVSCHQASMCWAVGSDSTGAAALHLVGGVWQRVPIAMPPVAPATERGEIMTRIGRVALHGVACTPTGDCLTVGSLTVGYGVGETLAEQWTGTSWVPVSTGYPLPVAPQRQPIPATLPQAELGAITCPSPDMCMAVGSKMIVNRRGFAISEHPLADIAQPVPAG